MRTSQTKQFEATTSAFLGPASFIRSLQSVVKLHQLYLLYFIHDVVAAVAKAQVYLTIKILKSVSSNPARGRNFFYFLILFFFYTFFLYFFICIELLIPWGKFTNHVDPLGGGEVLLSLCKWKPAYSAPNPTRPRLLSTRHITNTYIYVLCLQFTVSWLPFTRG